MKKERKSDRYIEAREKGMKYREIAEMYGVSFQAVAQACSKRKDFHFVRFTEERLIYPKWRKWMNDNKISTNELIRRMGNIPEGQNIITMNGYMRGDHYPGKPVMDKILKATGLTYEELWATEE